jgi:hypothetical protein
MWPMTINTFTITSSLHCDLIVLVTVLQKNIIGGESVVDSPKERNVVAKKSVPANFFDMSIKDGLDAKYSDECSMIVHRIIQKRILFSGIKTEKQRDIFLKTLQNEIDIKIGEIDACTATRDSLISFFVKTCNG